MRFSALVVGAYAALATAQSSSTTPTITPSATVASVDPAQTSLQAAIVHCISLCGDSDVNCKAKCVGVPYPDATQANATNTCVSGCAKGNGTAEDNVIYSNCVSDCIGQHYWSSSGGTPAQTAASGSASGSNSAATTGTGTAAGSASGTGSASQTTSTGAADAIRVGTSAMGLFGFLAALLAI